MDGTLDPRTANSDDRPALCRRIRELESLVSKLHPFKKQFHTITDAALDAIILMDGQGKISFWNKAAEDIFGYTHNEALGKDLHLLIAPEKYHPLYRKGYEAFCINGRGPMIGKILELTAVRKNGGRFPIGLSLSAIAANGDWHAIGILRDITERKKDQESLKCARDNLEREVAQRTTELCAANLELSEANIALKILLQKSSETATQIEANISQNIDDLIMPYIDALALKLDGRAEKPYLNIISDSLRQITSTFAQTLSAAFRDLTPREVQVAELIRQGHTTKEIARLLNVSPHTVDTYRAHLREKFNLKNQKANLKVYLHSFQK
ncbi:MAG: PAS domain S-box protein [Desulfobacterales bacterium]|nr:PAS domain S-box protein [Desulfobacterales bacterium]